MLNKKNCLTIFLVFSFFISPIYFKNVNSRSYTEKYIQNFLPAENIVITPYDYTIITVKAQKGQTLNGDWQVTPADVISPPFLIFIVNSKNLQIWLSYDNLTKVAKRIPSDEVLYLYDPLIREDDIPFDNRRSGIFLAKIPYSDNWSLVLYAGASLIPLSFQWSIIVTEGIWYDIVLYSIGSLLFVLVIIVFVIKIIKDKKSSNKDEIENLIKEQDKKKQMGNLEEIEK